MRKKRQSRRKKVTFALPEPSKTKVKKSNLVGIDEDQEIREIVTMKRAAPPKKVSSDAAGSDFNLDKYPTLEEFSNAQT